MILKGNWPNMVNITKLVSSVTLVVNLLMDLFLSIKKLQKIMVCSVKDVLKVNLVPILLYLKNMLTLQQ